MGYYGKATASQIVKGQALAWTGSGTVVSTNFLSQTREIRIIAQISGWIAIEPAATQGTVMSTSTFIGGTFIAANTANGDYFTVVPGQVLTFTSTSTSTGTSPLVSLSEMS